MANEFVARNGLIALDSSQITGSLNISGSLNVNGNITGSNILTTGTITAQTLVVQTITSSTDFVTGSTRFGTLTSNTHQFTGSVLITGSLNSLSITGSLLGTASYANQALTASNAVTASSADSFNVRNSLTASGLIYPPTDGTAGQFIITNGTGTLSFDDIHVLSEGVRYGESIS